MPDNTAARIKAHSQVVAFAASMETDVLITLPATVFAAAGIAAAHDIPMDEFLYAVEKATETAYAAHMEILN